MKTITLDKIPSFVDAILTTHDHYKQLAAERQEAFKLFASALTSAGIEVKPGDFSSLSAAEYMTLTKDIEGLNLKKRNVEVSTVGSPDPLTPGAWITH
jgi:hypothetical protein